jgi:hypothetical protein
MGSDVHLGAARGSATVWSIWAVIGAVTIVSVSSAARAQEPEDETVPLYADGSVVAHIGAADLEARGMTIVDLGDGWAPFVLRDAPGVEPQPYLFTYRALADERFGEGPEWRVAREDRYFELFGIPPTLRVIHERMDDAERHACHDGLDVSALESYAHRILPPSPPTPGGTTRRRSAEHGAAVRALRARLRCDRLLPARPARDETVLDASAIRALRAFQRKHAIVATGIVDDATKRALLEDSRELDFRTLLRALRERIVDATGLVEDGTGDAPDLVGQATDAAARALGWTDVGAARAWLATLPEGGTRALLVGMRLPAPPRYHGRAMELRAAIDRGDVYYTRGARRRRDDVRPTLTLFARDGANEIALVRWPTTIGGWKPERTPGGGMRFAYKESPVGRVVWRDLYATPAWLAPPSTPPEDMVVRSGRGYDVHRDLFEPGYHNAYGLVMLVHERPVHTREGEVLRDEGVRTHGTVAYRSILNGESHGCHRLFNHQALRLAGFVLRHHAHTRLGPVPVRYAHDFSYRGRAYRLTLSTRGYLFRVDPPIPVDVLEGTPHGRRPRERRAPAPSGPEPSSVGELGEAHSE